MKRKLKSILALALSAAMVAGVFTYTDGTVSAAKPKLNKSKVTLYVGNKVTLKVKGTKAKVRWSSSKKKVATVSAKGMVMAKSKGTAKITAKVASKKLTCKVTVKNKTVNPTDTPVVTVAPSIIPPTQQPATQTPMQTANPTAAPTEVPGPTATPVYMQEGAFVYDKLDISWIDPERPMIALTFDDGPITDNDNGDSMKILEVLKNNGCHATFNYVTSKINDKSKKEILLSLENGNEIANHTSQWGDLSALKDDAIAKEIEKARAALEELTGITNFTLRPPNLAVNDNVKDYCNVPLIGCSVDTADWQSSTTKENIINKIKSATDGDIVLCHETNPLTAEAIEEVVPYMVEQGYQIVSVVELFAAKDIPLFAGNYYNKKAEYMEPRN